MSQVYSTEELIEILAAERRACMNGQRLNLAVSPSGSPFLDKFLQPDGLQRFTAYSNFRAAVHEYQRSHQVSGDRLANVDGARKSLRSPKVDDQLIALPEDLAMLKAAKTDLFDFWCSVTAEMDLYLSLNAGKAYRRVSAIDVDHMMRHTEWANLTQQGKLATLELILQLGWGQPEAAAYRRGFPDSGSEHIHAVHPGMQPLV